jgi:hypothetical protein
MNIRKVVKKRIRHAEEGLDVVGDVNAAIAANVGERGSTSRVSSRQKTADRSDSQPQRKEEL